MIKKIFLTVTLLSTVMIYLTLKYFFEESEVDLKLVNQVVDINDRNVLIKTYSILIKEVIPANEQQ